MPKFVLMVSREAAGGEEVAPDVVQETFHVLCSLGHSESDARKLLDAALAGKTKYKDVESLLHAVYQHAAKK
jgi:Holliday junction DNA helicase RuvA